MSPGDISAVEAYYTTPLLRLEGWFHQTTQTSSYPLNATLRNVGAVPLRITRVGVGGRWLAGATPPTGEVVSGGSATLSLQAKACSAPGLQTDILNIEVEGGATYTLARTRACYRNPGQMTLLRVDAVGSETVQLTFAEWSWAKRYKLEGQVANQPIPLPYTELQTDRAQPLYTALLRLEGRRGQEVCLKLTHSIPPYPALALPRPVPPCAKICSITGNELTPGSKKQFANAKTPVVW